MKVINRKEHGTPGCARCRMDLIKFVEEYKLPRFTMHIDETYNLPQTSYRQHGAIEIGTGIAPAQTFVIIERDAMRASHNGLPCPGLKLEGYPDALPELIGARS